MIPFILAAIGGYLIGDSFGEEIDSKIPKFEDGGQTDDELYTAMTEMGYDYGDFATEDFDESGFSEMAINLGYRWDDKKKLWFNRDMMADGGMIFKKGDKVILKDGGGQRMAIIVQDGFDNKNRVRVRPDGFPMDISVPMEEKYSDDKRVYVIRKMADGGMMEKGGKINYSYTTAHGYTVYRGGKALESFKTEEQAKRFVKDLEKGKMHYADGGMMEKGGEIDAKKEWDSYGDWGRYGTLEKVGYSFNKANDLAKKDWNSLGNKVQKDFEKALFAEERESMKSMMRSLFTYGGLDKNSNYLEKHKTSLGTQEFNKIFSEYSKELNSKYKVRSSTYTDSEGLSYNELKRK